MFDVGYGTYVSEEQVAMWKELACLHFANGEIGKFCKRSRRYSCRTVTLDDGSRIMQLGLHGRLRALCVSMLGYMPGLGDSKDAFYFALSCTDLRQRLRHMLRSGYLEALLFLVQIMDAVMGHASVSSDRLIGSESMRELGMLRDGFARLTAN